MDRHKLDGSKTTVYAADEFVDCGAEILVFFDVLAGGDGQLAEDHLSDPLRMLGEEEFQRMKFLRDTLDVIKTVYTNDYSDVREPAF